MTTNASRIAVTAGAIGLVGGLALGVTGLASAVSPAPAEPGASTTRPSFGHLPPGARMGRRGAGGLVTAISPTSLTVRTPRGAKTIGLNASTTFFAGPTKATRSAIDVGDIVRVKLVDPKSAEPIASVVTVVPAHLAGWVTGISGSTVTLKDLSGFTRTLVTSSATKVTKDGKDATLADITVDSFIHARGVVASDGSTLEAAHVGIGLPEGGPHVEGGHAMGAVADLTGDEPVV